MFKNIKVKVMLAGLVLVSVFTLFYAQAMVWNETVNWLADEMISAVAHPTFQ